METSSQQLVFEKFERYDFAGDATFQNGLKSIVNGIQDKSEREQQEAIQNAKYFYFSRFVQNFDHDQYQAWRAQRPATSGSTSESSGTTHEGSAGQHGQLNTPDTTHTSIRQIPNNLAEGTPSEAKLAPKLKPWEAKKVTEAPAVIDT
ncbi:hypothetical protein BGZ70_003618 [Mortierella alpina]|uniref:Uncharacterized protein n=1 Tax=Mortierella alpina TaxID=64518 RepID=A0A9P6LVT9_MORAP|nr:hypothetical protein BGZ70_003618 [Mortierella alpina]